jgi:hypothetical protein
MRAMERDGGFAIERLAARAMDDDIAFFQLN